MRIMSPWSRSTVFFNLRANQAALIFLLLLGLALSAQAQSPARLFVDGKAAPGGNGLSWATAFSTIQPAVDAVASAGGEVWVAEGTYTGTGSQVVNIPATVKLYGGFAGTESTLTERNSATHQTIIDGQKGRRGVSNAGLLDGFVVQNGRTIDKGGGVFNNYGTVTNCTVTSNSTINRYASYGGGIYNYYGTVTGCTVRDNSANGSDGYGGGVYNYAGTVTGCTMTGNSAYHSGGGVYNDLGTVTGCTVMGNSIDGDYIDNDGGGVYNNYGTVTGCTVTGNSASNDGGGIYNNYGTVTDCTVTGNSVSYDFADVHHNGGGVCNYFGKITGCTVTGNSSNCGGGVFNYFGKTTGCTVTGNSANYIGGGVFNVGGGVFNNSGTVTDCTVTTNSADFCGGVFNESGTLMNCKVTGNSANGLHGDGGGVGNYAYDYSYGTVVNCTVTGNFANGNGGGVNNGSGTVTGCTVVGNSASGSGGGIYNYYGPVTNCIVWRNSKSDIIEGDSGSIVTYSCFGEATDSDHNLHADPRFVSTAGGDPLAWNLHLQAGSPCIGAGSKEIQNLPATDIEGNPRPGNDGFVDMGAYESTTPRIIRYLLGMETDPTGLDANGDGRVDIADAVSQVNTIPPATPTSPSPADQATTISLTPNLSWAAAPYAKSYDLYLWKATETTPTTPLVSGLPTPASDAPAALSYATVYNWRVVAHNVTAQTAGPVWQFTTRPYPVRVVSPNGGETWTRGTNVQVRYLADVRNSGTSYRIELWRGNSKAATLKAAVSNTVGDKTETIALPKTLTAASNYKVRVISIYMESHNGGPDAWDASDQPFTIK